MTKVTMITSDVPKIEDKTTKPFDYVPKIEVNQIMAFSEAIVGGENLLKLAKVLRMEEYFQEVWKENLGFLGSQPDAMWRMKIW